MCQNDLSVSGNHQIEDERWKVEKHVEEVDIKINVFTTTEVLTQPRGVEDVMTSDLDILSLSFTFRNKTTTSTKIFYVNRCKIVKNFYLGVE